MKKPKKKKRYWVNVYGQKSDRIQLLWGDGIIWSKEQKAIRYGEEMVGYIKTISFTL